MEWARLTANIEPELAKAAKKRAKSQRRSLAAYLANLIESDLKAHGASFQEEPAPYHHAGTPQTKVSGEQALREEITRHSQHPEPTKKTSLSSRK